MNHYIKELEDQRDGYKSNVHLLEERVMELFCKNEKLEKENKELRDIIGKTKDNKIFKSINNCKNIREVCCRFECPCIDWELRP